MKLLGVLVAAVALASAKEQQEEAQGELWALLVAGSNGYYNYRHQADVCHAYQVLKNHGVPEDHIVVMMYDDIANSTQNPTPGVIINHPDGKDVYHGVPKDYVGKDVTPEVFLKVLQGEAPGVGSGKVIASGPKDRVFLNFADHGAPGLVAFPQGELMAHELITALKAMHSARKYRQMVVYVEACESGSMFKGLLDNDLNIYATTAANSDESSYACYFDKKRQTYLGDVYSVKWMEDSDKENLQKESLLAQFQRVKKETNTSHVQEFGDLREARDPVGMFQGDKKARKITYPPVVWPLLEGPNCYEAPLDILYKRHSYERSPRLRQQHFDEIRDLLRKRSFVEKVYETLAHKLAQGGTEEERLASAADLQKKKPFAMSSENWPRYGSIVHHFSSACFDLGKNSYALKFVHVLANLANSDLPTDAVTKAMDDFCRHLQPVPGGVH